MNKRSLKFLNAFIEAPNLKINSELFPISNFNFIEEQMYESDFRFPETAILGLQAEACFQEYLTQSKHYKLLISNLQIQGKSKTLGEIDFIVSKRKSNEVIHIELACKFYLYDSTTGISEEERWIGPNRKDSLYLKLEKINSTQFPLITLRETISKLKSTEIEIPTLQQLSLKAFLFVPKEMDLNHISKNYKECIVGYWIRKIDFDKEDKTVQYAVPHKKQWLLPVDEITSWLSFEDTKLEIEKHFQNLQSPLIYKKEGGTIEKFFVVWW